MLVCASAVDSRPWTATANARVPKCVTEEATTRSPRVADRSLCLLPTVVTGRQRSAMYDGASPGKLSTGAV